MSTRRSRKSHKTTDEDMIAYHGPVTLPHAMNAAHTYKKNFSLTSIIASNAGGVVVNLYKSSDVTNVPSWTDMATIAQEYRVLAMEIEFLPLNPNITVGTDIVMALYPKHSQMTTAVASMNAAAEFEGCKFFASSFLHSTRQIAKATGSEELQWIATSTSSGLFGFGTYSTPGSLSTNYFLVVEKFLVEFRGGS